MTKTTPTALNLDRLARLKTDALLLLRTGINAVNGYKTVHDALRLDGETLTVVCEGKIKQIDIAKFKRILLIGSGKASVPMARAAKSVLGEKISESFVVTKYGYADEKPNNLTVFEAGHPIPDEQSSRAAREIYRICNSAQKSDLIINVISGGSSSLLAFPAGDITLEDKKYTTSLLLKSGATIEEMNAVRKHLSKIKGGQLAEAAAPATMINLILSDVVGDRVDTIGSGLTAPDHSTFQDANKVIEKYHLGRLIPESVRSRLQRGMEGRIPETPKADHECFDNVENFVIGSNRDALKAIESRARQLGYETGILTDELQGEAREVAVRLSARGKGISKRKYKACLISGGETTVTVKGNGKGGRNLELALAAAIEIDKTPNLIFLSAGTDGSDGITNAAGAIVDGSTLSRAKHLGLVATAHLQNNDSYSFFQLLGDLIVTGATETNVMDIQIILSDAM
jgi:hydroxypyruvate reductase